VEMADFDREMNRLDTAYAMDSNGGRRFIYWQRLNTISDAAFTEAVNRVMDTERNYPSIATLQGTCERIADEWARLPVEDGDVIREREPLVQPVCATCMDAGFIRYEMPGTQPSRLEKCPDCDGAFKGRDHRRNERERAAYLFMLDRDRARYPQAAPVDVGEHPDPAALIADLADQMAMDKRRPGRTDAE
jgi:hypothetical protein